MSLRYVSARGGAIVVGASSGIGAEVARELARRGYHVALVARREAELHTLAQAITIHQDLDNIRVYPYDVRDHDNADTLFARIASEFQAAAAPLGLLVYSAGVMPLPDAGGNWSFADEQAMVEINLLAAIQWCDLAAAYFAQRKSGAIIGISSVAGDRGRKGNSVYMATKAGLTTYLESLRYRLAGIGVRVVTIKPGIVATPMTVEVGTPRYITAQPRAVARRIADAATGSGRVVYTPWFWRPIMGVVRSLPGFIMERLTI
jgi:short-subunit dehydrogenase